MGTSFCSGLSFSPHPQPCHQESPPLHLPHPQGSGDTYPLSVTLLTLPPALQIPDSLQAGKVQEPRPLPSAPTKQTSSLAFHYCQSPKREQIGTGEQRLGLEQGAGLSGPLLSCPGLGYLVLGKAEAKEAVGLNPVSSVSGAGHNLYCPVQSHRQTASHSPTTTPSQTPEEDNLETEQCEGKGAASL